MNRLGIKPDWPYDIRRLPGYYGWVIWLISTLGFLFSIPGQTMGMAVFTDPLIEVLGLSRTQLSMAYLMGTLSSALFLTRAGRWYDRFGGRVMVALSSFALGTMLVFISLTDLAAESLGGGVAVSFTLIMLGYFGVRFFGQGVLTSASRNILLLWFQRRVGLVSSIRGVFVSLGFSLAPLLLAWIIAGQGWRPALWQLAAACGIFSIVALIALRDNPANCGVTVDGVGEDTKADNSVEPPGMTLAQARTTGVFWSISLGLSMHSLFITAVTFHIVSIFAEAGRSAEEAFGYFLPTAIVSVTSNLIAGWLADRRRLKPFLLTMLIAFICGALGLLNLSEPWGYALTVCGFGVGGGLWSVISNLGFIRNFGALHLGEISGLSTALMVFSSAIGPAMFSLGLDWFGSYGAAQWLCIFALLLILVFSVVTPHLEASEQHGKTDEYTVVSS